MISKWDSFWQSQDNVKYSWSKRRIIQIVDGYIESGMSVLDAGCGSGFFSAYFIERGCKTYSLDLSQRALELARRLTSNKSEEYICDDLLNDRLALKRSGMFDIIFSDGLFEHFSRSDQDKIFGNFITMSKGHIVTFVPNKYTLWRVLQPFYMHGIREQPFSLSELLNLYYRNNCIVSSFGGINVLPVRLSPEKLGGKFFGMLVYCVGGRTLSNG